MTIMDPVGRKTDITYAPLSDPDVYSASALLIAPKNNSELGERPSVRVNEDHYHLVTADTKYVVQQAITTNFAARNAFNFESVLRKTYSSALIDLDGRGWLGFQQVNSYFDSQPQRQISEYFDVAWPANGC